MHHVLRLSFGGLLQRLQTQTCWVAEDPVKETHDSVGHDMVTGPHHTQSSCSENK
jgi:hypothetical protein